MQYVRSRPHFSYPTETFQCRYRLQWQEIIWPLNYMRSYPRITISQFSRHHYSALDSFGQEILILPCTHHPAWTLWNDITFQGDNFQLIWRSADGESLFCEEVPFVKWNISAARKVRELDGFLVHCWLVEKWVHKGNLKTLARKVWLVEVGIVKCPIYSNLRSQEVSELERKLRIATKTRSEQK